MKSHIAPKSPWQSTKWGNLASLEYGKGLRGYVSERSAEKPVRVYGTNGPIGWHSAPLYDRPSVVVGRKGAYRGIHLTVEPFFVIDTAFYLVPKSELDIRWAYYQLKNFDINKLDSGSAIPSTNRESFYEIPVALPPLPIQRRIAGILSAYDDLIENCLRRIEILEAMARALYREWFVHFRFPGHENHPRAAAALCEIPQGWETLEFRHLFDIRYGKTLPKTAISDSGPYPVYGAGDVIGFYDKMLCPDKCALVTSRGNGSGTVWRTREAAFVTNNSLIMLPREERRYWDYSFIEQLLKHSNVMEARTGSAQPQVTIENLNYVKAIVPTKPLVEKFCAIITPAYDQVDLLFRQIQYLRRIRDLLLPRLLSGQIDVEAAATAA